MKNVTKGEIKSRRNLKKSQKYFFKNEINLNEAAPDHSKIIQAQYFVVGKVK